MRSYLKQNAPTDFLNPSVAPVVQIYASHNLLRGFGTGVNGRFIRVAQKNIQGGARNVSIATVECCCKRSEPVLGSGDR